MATDLDGTVVRSDDTVSARTIETFERVRALGIPIVGVTGRGPRLLDLCRRDLPCAGYFVLAQGAHVVDLVSAAAPVQLSAHSMDSAVVTDVLARLEAVAGPLSVLVEPLDAPDTMLLGEYHPSWRFNDAVRRCPRVEALTGRVIKAFAHSDTYSADELLDIARRTVGPELVELTQAGLGYVEICPPGVTKATGLAAVAAAIGVHAADVLVFGDMPNDLPMFGWAGWGRIAVANAHPSVLAAADEVTLSNDEHGVAAYLDQLTARPIRDQLTA